MSEVEYVGKTISREGLRMSDKQIKGVNDFPTPVNNTQLRSFLGFINYFRDHDPNHSNVVSPLTKMVDHSATKKTAIMWTPEGTLAFDTDKRLISASPTLYFLHEKIGIVGYWATSISTVRTTVLSENVIKTDLFPDLDIPYRILDIKDLGQSSRKICVLYRIVTV